MIKYSSTYAALAFAFLAIICKLRFLPLEANFALFGALSIFCGGYLRGTAAWLIPLLAMALSDALGQWLQIAGVYFYDTRAMLLNYAGLAAMIGCGHLVRRHATFVRILGSTLVGSTVFFLISNFGSWLDPLMDYEPTWSGLIQCYAMGLGFFRNTLTSDVVFALLFAGVHRLALGYSSVGERVSNRI